MKKVVIISSVVLIGAIVAVGVYMYIIYSKTNLDSSPSVQKTKNLSGQKSTAVPTEILTYPDGRKETVYPHQLLARINNQSTVKSFGKNISPTSVKGVYLIHVDGDLLQAEAAIKLKPGVEWVTTNAVPVS